MATHELVAATNELFRLSTRLGDVSPRDTARLLALACRALNSTLQDANLAQSLDSLAQSPSTQVGLATDGHHIEEFCRTFVRTERDLLQEAGLSEGAVRSLMDAGDDLLFACVATPLNVGKIYVGLHTLERRVCGRAGQLARSVSGHAQRGRRQKAITRSLIGVGGAAIIVVNAGAVPISLGLSTPMATLSVAFGGTLVSSAVGSPWDK